MKIALAQIDIIYNNQQANYPTIEHYVCQASKQGCNLIVFPEMCTTGFSMDCHCCDSLDFFQKLSLKYNILILYGEAIERDGHKYNNAKLIDGQNILLDYDKIHPFYHEADIYEAGDHIDVCQLEDLSVSCLICFDLRFPEIFQIASKKADVIFVIASWPEVRDEHWLTLLKARAIENQCFIAGINRVGNDLHCHYCGHSIVYDSYGNSMTRLNEEENLIIFEVNRAIVDETKGMKDIKEQRKEEIYQRYSAK